MNVVHVLIGTSDIDQMNHLNNQKYVAFLEKGRDNLYTCGGFPDEVMKARGLGRAVVQMLIQFHREVSLGERLTISTYPIRIGRSSFTLKQEIYNEGNELVNSAEVIGVIFDFEERKSVTIPTDFRTFLEKEIEKMKHRKENEKTAR